MKTVGIVEPVSSGLDLVKSGKIEGHRIIVFTANSGERKPDKNYLRYIDQIEETDTYCSDKLFEAVEKYPEIDTIIPGFEYSVHSCAEVSLRKGLLGLNPELAGVLRSKYQFRKTMKALGFSCPNYHLIQKMRPDSLISARRIKYPAVIKPTDMAGSIGVKKIYSHDELVHHVEEYYRTIPTDLENTSCGDLIIEEFVEGSEYSIEGIVSKSGIDVLSVTTKSVSDEPFFIELGHKVCCDLGNKHEVLVRYAKNVLRALNYNIGPFHLEVKHSEGLDPVAIEMGARLPGDYIVDLIENSSGVSMSKETLNCFLGKDVAIKPSRNSHSEIRFFHTQKGIFNEATGIESAQRIPGVNQIKILYTPNDAIPSTSDFRARLGFVIATASDPASLSEVFNKVEQTVRIR